jgi:hypothetical protein
MNDTRPGRSCPLHYRYAPSSLDRAPEIVADTLYVVGGLYGNRPALRTLEQMAAQERATLAFNGDFNWFNSDDDAFAGINDSVLRHHALRGNVETEIAGDDDAAGCGCGYPESVSDAEVERSNAILSRLRATAGLFPTLRERLGALPMTLTAEVGGLHVAIVHGDCESLAGWSYDESALRDEAGISRVAAHCAAAGARVIASSHTCLPVALRFGAGGRDCALFNNGAAGMPNFAGTGFGVITRIATTQAPLPALYGTVVDGVHIDALPLHYDRSAWQAEFEAQWPEGSEAALSYGARIRNGPRYGLNRAMGPGIRVSHALLRQLQSKL